MKSSLILLDTFDDRREIWSLLHRLNPRARVGFLAACCARVRAADPKGNGPVPNGFREMIRAAFRADDGNERLTNAVYGDLLNLSSQWGFDLVKAAGELEQLIRHPRRPASPGTRV